LLPIPPLVSVASIAAVALCMFHEIKCGVVERRAMSVVWRASSAARWLAAAIRPLTDCPDGRTPTAVVAATACVETTPRLPCGRGVLWASDRKSQRFCDVSMSGVEHTGLNRETSGHSVRGVSRNRPPELRD
jgi:hypothetical protein